MQDRKAITITDEAEMRRILGIVEGEPGPTRKAPSMSKDRATDLAIGVLFTLKGLSRDEKRRVLALAGKLLG